MPGWSSITSAEGRGAGRGHGPALSAVQPGLQKPPAVVVAQVRAVVLERAVPNRQVDGRGHLDVILLGCQVALELVDELPALRCVQGASLTDQHIRRDRIVDVADVS